MIPHLTVEPISENKIRVVLSTGVAIEISDGAMIGGEIFVSETVDGLRLGKFKRIIIVPKGSNFGGSGAFAVEMKSGCGY
jgi:hypothetical protein